MGRLRCRRRAYYVNVGRRFDGLAAHYRLSFAQADATWRLERCDYRDLHGQIPPEVVDYWNQHGWPPGMQRP